MSARFQRGSETSETRKRATASGGALFSPSAREGGGPQFYEGNHDKCGIRPFARLQRRDA